MPDEYWKRVARQYQAEARKHANDVEFYKACSTFWAILAIAAGVYHVWP